MTEWELRSAYIKEVGTMIKTELSSRGFIVEQFHGLAGITIKFPGSEAVGENYLSWLNDLLTQLPDPISEPVKLTFNLEQPGREDWVVINAADDYRHDLKWQIKAKNITGEYKHKK